MFWWGFFHGFSLLLPHFVLVPHAQWVKHSLPSPPQNLRASLPQHQWVDQHVESPLCLQFPLHWTFQQWSLQLGDCPLHLLLVSSTTNGTASPTAHLKVKATEGLCWHQGRQHQQWPQYSAPPAGSQPQLQTTGAWVHQSPFQSS